MTKLTMEDTKKTLRECPFCGKNPELNNWPDRIEPFYTIRCDTCNIELESFDYEGEPQRHPEDSSNVFEKYETNLPDWLKWAEETQQQALDDLISLWNGKLKKQETEND